MKHRALLRHLQCCDCWMRELSGWLWARRENPSAVLYRGVLIQDIRRGEKLIAKLKKGKLP